MGDAGVRAPGSSSPDPSRAYLAKAIGSPCERSFPQRPRPSASRNHTGIEKCWWRRCCRWPCPHSSGPMARSCSPCRPPRLARIRVRAPLTHCARRWTPNRDRPSQPDQPVQMGRGYKICWIRPARSPSPCTRRSTSGWRGPISWEPTPGPPSSKPMPPSLLRPDLPRSMLGTGVVSAIASRCVGSCPMTEEPLLDALARLHARSADGLGTGTRLLGTFRALGRLVPVWDLRTGTPVEDVEEPAAALAARLGEALAVSAPLSTDERRARSGLANRQVTIR